MTRFNQRQLHIVAFFGLLWAAVLQAQAFDLMKLIGMAGDSGSGKVAHLEFRLDDGYAATSVVWSPDGRYIATTGAQTRTLHIWDVEKRKIVQSFESPNAPTSAYHSLAWSPDGRYLAKCGTNTTGLRIYDTATWQVAKDFDTNSGGCAFVRFSADSAELAGMGRNSLTTISTATWQITRHISFDQPTKRIFPFGNDLAYLPGTKMIVMGGNVYQDDDQCSTGKKLTAGHVWFIQPGQTILDKYLMAYCSPEGDSVELLATHPDGRLVTSTLSSSPWFKKNSVFIFDLSTGKKLAAPLDQEETTGFAGLTFTPDGNYLLAAQAGIYSKHTIFIIDARTYQILDRVHTVDTIYDVAVRSDSAMFAVSAGGGVTVWRFVKRDSKSN